MTEYPDYPDCTWEVVDGVTTIVSRCVETGEIRVEIWIPPKPESCDSYRYITLNNKS